MLLQVINYGLTFCLNLWVWVCVCVSARWRRKDSSLRFHFLFCKVSAQASLASQRFWVFLCHRQGKCPPAVASAACFLLWNTGHSTFIWGFLLSIVCFPQSKKYCWYLNTRNNVIHITLNIIVKTRILKYGCLVNFFVSQPVSFALKAHKSLTVLAPPRWGFQILEKGYSWAWSIAAKRLKGSY